MSGTDVFVAGSTDGRFPRQKANGGTDAFVARFTGRGRLAWLKQFGTHRDDEGAAISAAGCDRRRRTTRGPLDRQRLAASDAFVMRLTPGGLESWTRLIGGDGEDRGLSVALRTGQVFLAGTTEGLYHTVADQDGFVAGFDRRGRPAWSYPLGRSDTDAITSIARARGVYFRGCTRHVLDEEPAGVWTRVGKLEWTARTLAQAVRSATDDRPALSSRARVYSPLHAASSRRHAAGRERRLPRSTCRTAPSLTRQFGTADYDAVYGMASTRGRVPSGPRTVRSRARRTPVTGTSSS